MKNKWQKIFRWQEKGGWCGPAVIQMALAAAGIKKTQKEIARDVYLDWWGTFQQAIYAYLSKFFSTIDFKDNATIADLESLLKKKYIVIVDWWDDLDLPPDGHHTLVSEIDKHKGTITLLDPSGARAGIWTWQIDEFKNHWYDYLDFQNTKKVEGWVLWLDPKSKI